METRKLQFTAAIRVPPVAEWLHRFALKSFRISRIFINANFYG